MASTATSGRARRVMSGDAQEFWDAIHRDRAAFFAHTPLELDYGSMMARAADRAGRGGALLVVGHSTPRPWTWEPENTDGLMGAGELASALALHEPAWNVRLAKEVEGTVTHAGREKTILDAVLHAVRA